MSAWQPADDELDAIARSIPRSEPSPSRAEEIRTSVLAGAVAQRQLPRRPAVAIVAAVAIPLAIAAALLIWIGTRGRPEPKDSVVARASARYEVASDWPDRVVRLHDGTLDVHLRLLDAGERFRLRAPDAELESSDASFTVAVQRDHLDAVAVARGSVELRVTGSTSIFLAAGQTWSRTITAQRDELVAPPKRATPSVAASKDPATESPKTGPSVSPAPKDPRSADTVSPRAAPKKSPATEPKAETPTPKVSVTEPITPPLATDASTKNAPRAIAVETAPRGSAAGVPGEAEFRAGIIALRSGDAGAATASFATACGSVQGALAEDACFWAGAAARRAGQIAVAREALQRFLQRFPSSARAGEASALLGWIVLDTGDVAGAERLFRAAANDRVPQVRDSAARGLAAIERRRPKP